MNNYFELIITGTDITVEKISVCKYCGKDFPLYSFEKKLLDKQNFNYPRQCSVCTFRMLYSYINDKHLYTRKDSENNKNIISILSESYIGKVIEANKYKKYLLDDIGLKFSKEVGSDIFSDFKKLYNSFPKPSRLIYPGVENADYASHVGWAKNIYLSYCVFVDCENIYYSNKIVGSCKNVFNSFLIGTSENIYNSSLIVDSYNVSYGNNIKNCSDLLFSNNMQDSKSCIFCCNQVNSSYKIFNKQYTKENYKKAKKDILNKLKDNAEFKKLESIYKKFLEENLVEPAMNILSSEKAIGDNIYFSRNVSNIFSSESITNSINIIAVGGGTDDINDNILNSVEGGTNTNNVIGSCSFGTNVSNIFFSYGVVENSKNIYYSFDIENCEECMFSVGLKGKKYCILNKQYQKQEYFKLKEKIIKILKRQGKWGDFTGFDMSIFPYNDTLSYDYFKVNKIIYFDKTEKIIDKNANGIVTIKTNDFISDAILDLGGKEKIKIKWRTKNKEINIPIGMDTIEAKDLPNIDNIDNNILNKVIICEESSRPFRIIKKELNYLKKKGFPLSTIHHDLRIAKLIEKRPIGELYLGICDNCNKNMLSVFKTKPKAKVYCNDCYTSYMFN